MGEEGRPDRVQLGSSIWDPADSDFGFIFLGCMDISGEPVIGPHSPGLYPQTLHFLVGGVEPRGPSLLP